MVLNNFYWCVWAIMMLSEDDETDVKAFNWDFIVGRCGLHERSIALFGIGQV